MSRWARLLNFTLVLVFAATSLTVAAARGQHPPAGSVILCSGTGAIVIPVDAQGNPTGPAHICPDFAMVFLSVVAGEPPQLTVPLARILTLEPAPVAEAMATRSPPVARARGPPALV